VIETVRQSLTSTHDKQIVDELLAAYEEAKRNFYQGGKRLSAVEGGRFCEAVFRLLEEETTGSFTPLGHQINAEALSRRLANLAPGTHPDSIRLHIPRALRVVYDVRNNRDAAHLADGIDPNLQDASLVVSVLDWVLAELLRLWHCVSADEAQALVEDLVTRRAPAIEDFEGFLKVLKTQLTAGEHILVLLYQAGRSGITDADLRLWARPAMLNNLGRTLGRLQHDLAYIHRAEKRSFISARGRRYVEENGLILPD
jgi:hypothetical protein